MVERSSPPGMTDTLQANIELLTARRKRDRAEAPLSDRIADRITGFTGSMTFVVLHLAFFGSWIGWNLWGSPKFDPSFVVLAMMASVEAIFLSTFVLISQNRSAEAADARADLDLHISLLTEHELSKLAGLVSEIARKLDLDPASPDLEEIAEDVQPDRVLDALECAELPGDEKVTR